MTKSFTKRLFKGMDLDSLPEVKDPNSYDYAENFRFLAHDEVSQTGGLFNLSGATYLTNLYTYPSTSSGVFAGSCRIRNYLVIFMASVSAIPYSTTNLKDEVWRFEIEENSVGTQLKNGEVIYSSSSSNTDRIVLPPSSIIPNVNAKGRYESEDVIKVYWSQGEYIRMINIMEDYSGYSDDKLLLKPDFQISTYLNSIKVIDGGTLPSGRVQYAFQLFKKYGQSTMISGPTKMVNLYPSNLSAPTSGDIKGGEIEENSGKSVSYTAYVDSTDAEFYDKARVYRILYTQHNQLPTITIVGDFDFVTLSGNEFIDFIDIGGEGLGEISIEEFTLLSKVNLKGTCLEEKDETLFIGNITEETFDVTYDARAYRFTGSRTCNLYDSYIASTPDYTFSGVGFPYTKPYIPVEYPCINQYNSIANDYLAPTARASYQSDGSTLGGEGIKVKYKFIYDNQDLDTVYSTSEQFGVSSAAAGTINPFEDYASPVRTAGYQREEVYRFGLELFDSKGRVSPVKWIGDIRFPGVDTNTGFEYIVLNSGSKSIMRILGIKFTVDLPSNVAAWRIVRAKRKEEDKTVKYTGLGFYTIDVTTGDATVGVVDEHTTYKSPFPLIAGTPDGAAGGKAVFNKQVLSFVSPESIFGYRNLQTGDRVDLVGRYTSSVNDTTGTNEGTYPDTACSGKNLKNTIKYRNCLLRGTYTDVDSYTVTDVDFTANSNPSISYSFSEAESNGYQHHCVFRGFTTSTPADGECIGEAGTCYTIEVDSAVDDTDYSSNQVPYIYVMTDNTARYGGYSYNDRLKTEYIPASPIMLASTTYYSSYWGDTYINMFDYTNCIYSDVLNGDDTYADENRNMTNIIFPVESTINSSLRRDESYKDLYNVGNSYLLREQAGTHLNSGTGDTFLQPTDLYLYNPVYSQEQNINVNYEYNYQDNFRTSFDNRIVHSDFKYDTESFDSWTVFRPNNALDMKSAYGPIKDLQFFNNEIYVFQEDAVGKLSINQRSLVSDSSGSNIALGDGGVLDKVDYLTTSFGTNNSNQVDVSMHGLYWIDPKRKTILYSNGQSVELLSKTKKVQTYIDKLGISNLKDTKVIVDSKYGEVLFRTEDDKVLVYNELSGNFISFYTTVGVNAISDFIDIGNKLLGFNASYNIYDLYSSKSSMLGLELSGSVNSIIRTTFAPDFQYTKVFDNLRFFSTSFRYASFDPTVDPLDNRYIFTKDTFNKIKVKDQYQYSEQNLTLGDTLEKREQEFFTDIPRNLVDNDNGATSVELEDSNNWDSTRQFRERMRDKYLTVDLIYDNQPSSQSITSGGTPLPNNFGVQYVTLDYRISNR